MRIKELHLKNFKRFTDLTIKDLPESSKLVVLIGSNGSGKSCVFDAFSFIDHNIKQDTNFNVEFWNYFRKETNQNIEVGVQVHRIANYTIFDQNEIIISFDNFS